MLKCLRGLFSPLLVNRGQYFFFLFWKEQVSCFVAFTFYCSFTNCLISNLSFKKLFYFFPLFGKPHLRYLLRDLFPSFILVLFLLVHFGLLSALCTLFCLHHWKEKSPIESQDLKCWTLFLESSPQFGSDSCTRLTSSPGEGFLAEIWEFLDQ